MKWETNTIKRRWTNLERERNHLKEENNRIEALIENL